GDLADQDVAVAGHGAGAHDSPRVQIGPHHGGVGGVGAGGRVAWGAGGGGLIAGPAVLEFVQVWNDFFVSLMISGAGVSPWSLLLWGEARHFEENLPQLAAGSLVFAIVPVTLLLATWRRFLVPALTGGVLR
ncbi:hypothetical protein, partial [Nocardia cyriacigeorgica]|uniref:hypothetical protein n=1 Tax=Nocardia cyriacigeorgica TaxID=135487 RepID=UPI00245859FC